MGMIGLLLDTNIVSELRRPTRNLGFRRWWESVESDALYLSAITLGEIEYGVQRLARKDADRAQALAEWAAEIHHEFSSRVLPVDGEVARTWGRFSALRTRPVADALIAATAHTHDLTLVTRNVADFADLPVRLLDPFD